MVFLVDDNARPFQRQNFLTPLPLRSFQSQKVVDATQPATLNDGAGVQTDCPTLGEAVTAWQRLRPEQKIRATIKVIGGPVYTAHEIDRLHQGPKPE